MTASENFARSLVRSARTLDAPAAGAKERALEQLASAAATTATAAGAASGTAAVAAAPVKLGALAWAVAAGIALAGAGAYGVAHRTTAPQATSTATPVSMTVEPASPPTRARSAPSMSAATNDEPAPAATVNACLAAKLPESAPTTCSRPGKAVPFSIKNQCGADVDVFWVDDKCNEVFHTRLGQEQSWRRVSQSGHVWRIRDHATHALVKEFSPQRVPGAPELVHNAPRRTLPEVVVHANDRGKEEPPTECSGYGLPSSFKLKNERDDQIVVMWIGQECEEKYHQRVGPKQTVVMNGVDADAWRIRDAKTGEVITDISPDVPDTSTYVTVP
jgi:hypothetical protein